MSQTTDWVPVTRCESIPVREGRAVKLGGHEIAIFNLGDRFLAVANRCPHQGGPLADGIVSGPTVVCPLHAWKIDLTSGLVNRPTDVAACVETFSVRVQDGIVMLAMPAQSQTGRRYNEQEKNPEHTCGR